MPVFKTVDGLKNEADVTDGTSNIFDKYTTEGGGLPGGTRLFVGGLTMDTPSSPEVDDQVLVVFEHGDHSKNQHPDFLWAPTWIV
jgi:hypothetical protein